MEGQLLRYIEPRDKQISRFQHFCVLFLIPVLMGNLALCFSHEVVTSRHSDVQN